MRIIIIYLILFTGPAFSFSQEVEVMSKTTTNYNRVSDTYTSTDNKNNDLEDFYWQFIDTSIDSSYFKPVSTIRIRERKLLYNTYQALSVMEDKIRKSAAKMGANCFKLHEFSYTGNSKYYTLVLDTYYATDSVLTLNKSKKPTNILVIFPDRISIKKPVIFKINGTRVKLTNHQCYMYNLGNRDEVKLERGLDTKIIKPDASRQPVYIELDDWTPYPTDSNQINLVHESFGELLLKTLFNTPVSGGN